MRMGRENFGGYSFLEGKEEEHKLWLATKRY